MTDCRRFAAETDRLLAQDHEVPALVHALDGRFVPPAPGGDLLRTPAILPTGRNIHGFDPFRMPSAFALSRRAPPRRNVCWLATRRTMAVRCRSRSLWCCGAPITSSRRRWADRPGFGADRCAAAFRQLWAAGRGRTHPARGARAAAHRCDRHALGDLPRSACRFRPECWPRRRFWRPVPMSLRSRTSCASTRCSLPAERTRLRSGDRGAAGLQQRRRRLRLERQSSDRQRLLGARRTNCPDVHAAQVLRLRGRREAGAAERRC